MDSCGEYFLFYGLTDFVLFLVLAWRYGSFSFLSKILSVFLYPESWHRPRPICSWRCLIQNWFSFSLFPLTGRRCHFRFRVRANHLAFIFFLPLSGDSLGLLYVPVPHSLPIRSQSTNICYFPFWPGFVTSGLAYIISLNGHSLTACYC